MDADVDEDLLLVQWRDQGGVRRYHNYTTQLCALSSLRCVSHSNPPKMFNRHFVCHVVDANHLQTVIL